MKTQKMTTMMIALMLCSCMPLLAAQMVISIDVAPKVLNLHNQGEVVTIHTDLPFSDVEASSVTLNGIEIESWKTDNQGNFVAKFEMSAVKNLLLKIDEYNTLTLKGTINDGWDTFVGSKSIMVVNRVPKGK